MTCSKYQLRYGDYGKNKLRLYLLGYQLLEVRRIEAKSFLRRISGQIKTTVVPEGFYRESRGFEPTANSVILWNIALHALLICQYFSLIQSLSR